MDNKELYAEVRALRRQLALAQRYQLLSNSRNRQDVVNAIISGWVAAFMVLAMWLKPSLNPGVTLSILAVIGWLAAVLMARRVREQEAPEDWLAELKESFAD